MTVVTVDVTTIDVTVQQPAPVQVTVAPAVGIGGNATGIPYTPDDPTKWRAPAPTKVGEALDQIADRGVPLAIDGGSS